MSMNKSFHAYISAAIIMLLASGCNDKPSDQVVPASVPVKEPAVTIVAQPPVTTAPKDTAEPVVPAPAVPPASDNDKVATASSDKSGGSVDGDTKPSNGKPKIDIKSPYTEAKPTLLGLALRTAADEIKSRFGKPKDVFTMEDDTDPITVYDYSDFLVGFDKKNKLQFIDVRSSDIDPGLNGLKLGDPVADAFQALGKPDGNTTLVLTYKAAGAILKLDIDPKTQKINSIKLFGA